MARPLRLEYPGAIYHITARGNARADIVVDDEDRQRILAILGEVVGRFNWLCHAYCLGGRTAWGQVLKNNISADSVSLWHDR